MFDWVEGEGDAIRVRHLESFFSGLESFVKIDGGTAFVCFDRRYGAERDVLIPNVFVFEADGFRNASAKYDLPLYDIYSESVIGTLAERRKDVAALADYEYLSRPRLWD